MCTAALALHEHLPHRVFRHPCPGGKGFLKSLAAPTPIMTPMNILEIAIRPTSLCMRLFGNVLGAFVIMELIKLVVPVFVPAVFSLYFDLFECRHPDLLCLRPPHLAADEREHWWGRVNLSKASPLGRGVIER